VTLTSSSNAGGAVTELKTRPWPPPPPSIRLGAGRVTVDFFGAGSMDRREDPPAAFFTPVVFVSSVRDFLVGLDSSSSSAYFGTSTVMRTGPLRRLEPFGAGRESKLLAVEETAGIVVDSDVVFKGLDGAGSDNVDEFSEDLDGGGKAREVWGASVPSLSLSSSLP